MRWGWLQVAVNSIEDDREIIDHLVVPESDHAIAALRYFRRSCPIVTQLICVLAAVEFNDEFLLRTSEVHDPASDRMLASELQLRKALA